MNKLLNHEPFTYLNCSGKEKSVEKSISLLSGLKREMDSGLIVSIKKVYFTITLLLNEPFSLWI